ncbi:signal recognition particle-docking protein FtsY [Helicobacter marmotae]|uniref:Signal recognition particle-docking protein FtsY n=1 Tax=Helicobacter marmotae TaxID=152490 RepID=A0A3D8I5Z0_9HELI|nr:signal recognition particle-docking protein FtsY [Helicobacter marmotae]RDU60164.1 signal recognition particle-docking protein FtsY [Helicobacter marmotae]
MISSIKKSLQKTTQNLASLIGSKKDKCTKDELEEILIECDVSYDFIELLLEELPPYISYQILHKKLLEKLDLHSLKYVDFTHIKPLVTLIVGVNGAGKTTTIAKLAKRAQQEGKKVMLGAGDTFRAAAIEQLKLWGEKLQIPVISTQHGHDPSAVAFDSINAAKARGIDELYIDTAGRLHNHTNLNNELLKIVRVSQKALGDLPLRTYLVLDGTQGSQALNQARTFCQHIDFSGIIITKLDGTSKGGAIFSIINELKIPICFIGSGEGADDLNVFDIQSYIQTILDCIFTTHS